VPKATSAALVRVVVDTRRRAGTSLDQLRLALRPWRHRGPLLSFSRLFQVLHRSQACWLIWMQGLRGSSRPIKMPAHYELAPGDWNMRWQGSVHRPGDASMPSCETESPDVMQQRPRAPKPPASELRWLTCQHD